VDVCTYVVPVDFETTGGHVHVHVFVSILALLGSSDDVLLSTLAYDSDVNDLKHILQHLQDLPKINMILPS
jgi:hypothetical protein